MLQIKREQLTRRAWLAQLLQAIFSELTLPMTFIRSSRRAGAGAVAQGPVLAQTAPSFMPGFTAFAGQLKGSEPPAWQLVSMIRIGSEADLNRAATACSRPSSALWASTVRQRRRGADDHR